MSVLGIWGYSEGEPFQYSLAFTGFLTVLPVVLFTVGMWMVQLLAVLAHDLGGDSQDGMP